MRAILLSTLLWCYLMADPNATAQSLWDAILAHYRQGGLEMAEQGRRPLGEQARSWPVTGAPLRAMDAYSEGRPWAAAGNAALSALELAPVVPPIARGVTGAVNAMRPGIMRGATKLGTAQYMGGAGVRSTMPEDMDELLRAYAEGTRAYPAALDAFRAAETARPEQLANAVRLHKEMGTPTTGRGASRNRELQRRAEQDIPAPVHPSRPEEPPFMHAFPGMTAEQMLSIADQNPTLPAIAGGLGLLGLGSGVPQELAHRGTDAVSDRIQDWAEQPPEPRDYSKSPYRLEESPEARSYNDRMKMARIMRNLAIGASGLTGAGAVATLPLLKEVSSPMTMAMGSLLDSPALMLMGLGPAAVPLGLGATSIASGVGAHGAHRHMKELQRLLQENYGRDRPAMEQGPITDY